MALRDFCVSIDFVDFSFDVVKLFALADKFLSSCDASLLRVVNACQTPLR
jgi:hypothetical protein